jgi:nucleotidyltransferase/DNA polymerase involved in DNA repair
MTLLAHVDADSFYVSCERVRCLALRRQPVGVISNQGAVVIARSYEMRPFGVRVGTPIWDAAKLCPRGIFLKRDFRWYEVISRRLLETLRGLCPVTEFYSVDEMFFDAGPLAAAFGLPLPEALRALQAHILQRVGIPVTIGLASTKTLAKLVSESVKPFGCSVLDPAARPGFLARKPVEDVTGIGRRSAEKLHAHGIRTCLDLIETPRRFIRQLLTIRGQWLWHELRGEPAHPIVTQRPAHKALSRGGSLGVATADPLRLTGWLVRNLERLVEGLDHYQVHADQLTLHLGFKGGGSWGGSLRTDEPTARFDLLAEAGKKLLGRARVRRPVSRMHLWAERLTRRDLVQGVLFPADGPAARKAAEVKRAVNRKLGRFAVRSGDTLPLHDIYADAAASYDICDIHGKQCF